eukprot:2921185-Lingulodinium_polyedra.AAC.1
MPKALSSAARGPRPPSCVAAALSSSERSRARISAITAWASLAAAGRGAGGGAAGGVAAALGARGASAASSKA